VQYTKILASAFLCCLFFHSLLAQQTQVSGQVTDSDGTPLPGALVKISGSHVGVVCDAEGNFRIPVAMSGQAVLEFSFLGYGKRQVPLSAADFSQKIKVILETEASELEEVTVLGKSELAEIREKAFNVSVVDARKLHHTNLDMGHALDRVSGIRVRESGGVGSRMNLSLNGFSGKQIKFFIDGIPMDDFGSSFQLNNIPVNLAERIEVYKGVVPVGLGADALGGAVNIVTKNTAKSYADISYSYGSFNTHRSVVNTAYVAPSGFTVQLNAFQNYSDNSYWIDVDVADINTGKYYPNQRVRRFHDTYHNETVITQIGFLNKPFADRLLIGLTAGKNYSEVQTGARLVTVFGAWHRKGNILMPTLKYQKSGLLNDRLTVALNANYNFGTEQNIDTLNRRYNWFQQYKEYDMPGGERSRSTYKYSNNNAVVSANARLKTAENQFLTLSYVLNHFNREGSDELYPENNTYEQPRQTQKQITGLGYELNFREKGSISAFGKYYAQSNFLARAYNPTGNYGDVAYRNQAETTRDFGFGATGAWFLTGNLQAKASFEKAYRLPEPEELFGDMINLAGNLDLKPESSYNYNLGMTLWKQLKKNHRMDFSANGFYRDARDFIRARLNSNQAMTIMDNLYNVTNAGVEGEVRYSFMDRFSTGFNITWQNLRNNTEYEPGQTIPSLVYRDRIPNIPYFFGNADAQFHFPGLIKEGQDLSVAYNLLYVHDFYLYWPSLGSDKFDVPSQVSQDINVTYTAGKKAKWQFTAECRNIFDAKLYDNFSLQKPGRAFYGKIRFFIY
jgi:outer membrane receptor protein involved in Fe transport